MKKEDKMVLNKIAQTIFDKKGVNILALDLRPLSTLTNYVVIAEGNVDRHVIAIGHAIVDELKKMGERPLFIEGESVGDWLVLDYGFVMVHLFQPGMREKYQLEKLWKDANIIDLDIKL